MSSGGGDDSAAAAAPVQSQEAPKVTVPTSTTSRKHPRQVTKAVNKLGFEEENPDRSAFKRVQVQRPQQFDLNQVYYVAFPIATAAPVILPEVPVPPTDVQLSRQVTGAEPIIAQGEAVQHSLLTPGEVPAPPSLLSRISRPPLPEARLYIGVGESYRFFSPQRPSDQAPTLCHPKPHV
ncbi:Uncharacterised protein (plasmid) [Legionella adelaidensis]|uniref:Uncharacterized protein n=1 Tax=Legionella adelaidensis TaxID=45056 RepID=A0A0W0R4U3_9GAMM|nr:hypothetical protein [Legionella adelaidensis]KTC66046.1 hypothetical protein Lade_0704 [Legionella adelaidensis]VEH85736.1 Uncharacterised protein [Legionella adelaidensis]